MCRCGPVWGLLTRVNSGVVEVMCVSVAGYIKRLTQLTAYGTCTDVRNDLGCHSGGISFAECTVTWNLWGACFTLWLVGAFIGSSFWDKILGARHAGAL